MTEICSGFVMRRTQAPKIAGFVVGITASANCDRCGAIKHDPEKWMPVFGKDHASSNSMIPKSGCRFPACAKPRLPFTLRLVLRRAKAGRKRSCLKQQHDPEKWMPVSRLREASFAIYASASASAGEGRSEKIMPQATA
jgi:hypothetical protein